MTRSKLVAGALATLLTPAVAWAATTGAPGLCETFCGLLGCC